MENKRLYRSSSEKVIGGVAGGIAGYFAIDPAIIRIIFVLLTIFGGGGLLIYIILWIALPEDGSTVKNNMSQPHFHPQEENEIQSVTNRKPINLVFAIILISIGLSLLLDKFLSPFVFNHLWPLALIIAGGYLLYRSFSKK